MSRGEEGTDDCDPLEDVLAELEKERAPTPDALDKEAALDPPGKFLRSAAS